MARSQINLRRAVALGATALLILSIAVYATACSAIPGLIPPTATPTRTPTPTYTPTPTATPTRVPFAITIAIEPANVPQGQIGTLVITTNRPATVTATLADQALPLFEEQGRWYGLAGIGAAAEPGDWPVVITAEDPLGGPAVTTQCQLHIAEQPSEIESVELTETTFDLLLDSEAVQKEAQLISELVTPRTQERLWQGAFQQPVQGEVTSTYSLRRSYNGGPAGSYHGGLDLAAGEGLPIGATNAGRVVFAEPLKVRGNVVIIDHGWGLYSGYFHMSALKVTAGQYVQQGETIGLLGSTGLSTGPHLHWSIWLGGDLIDPAYLTGWQLPG